MLADRRAGIAESGTLPFSNRGLWCCMLLFPKPKRRIKPRKPLNPGRKKTPARSKFKEFAANPLKSYRRRFTDAEVMAKAIECRRERLASPTGGGSVRRHPDPAQGEL
jgi:hypothetical protein